MARGAQEFDSLEGWLRHTTRGANNFLTGWKKKPGFLDTWMHCARLPVAIWRHSFPMFVAVEDKKTQESVTHVYNKKFVCHESEDVLTHPWRDKQSGERDEPPQRCGMCKFGEWLWQQCVAWCKSHTWDDEAKVWQEVKKGKSKGIDPCAIIFDFESEASDEETTRIHAGGYSNFFGQKNLPDGLKEAMKKFKVRGDETWMENCNVKCEYAMCVVDNADPGSGVRIAIETQALGEKVKDVIMKVHKGSKMNIQKTPYCIQWEFKEKEEFSKKYEATAMMEIKPTTRILKLIRGEAPDLEPIKECYNQQSMKAIFEKYCKLKDVPWNDFFPTKEQEAQWEKDDAQEVKDVEEQESRARQDEETPDGDDDEEDVPASSKPDVSDEDADEELVACDNKKCGKPIKMSDPKCPHCGHEYEVSDSDDSEPPPPVKMKSRSEIAKEKADAKTNGANGTTTKKKKKVETKSKDDDEDDDDDSQGDEIPF